MKNSQKEPGKRSRLWKYKDIYDTLTKKTGTEAVEAIVLDSRETKEISLSLDAFSKMNKLRLLMLSNVQLPNGLNYLSNDLCLLDWDGYLLKYLPSNFLSDRLVILKMLRSCVKQPWNGRMCLNKLKYVDLSYSPCITKILDFTRVTNLKELTLGDCMNLVEIGPSIVAIKRIMYLNLKNCKNLKVLPPGCWLKSLERLYLSGCSKLQNVFEVLKFTECLISLDLKGTCVRELPIEHLSNLRYISLQDCKELTSLPSGICGLKLLENLIVSGCSKLSKLPENLGGLQRLHKLHADFTAIKQPPSSIAHMKRLRVLSFRGCKGGVTSTPWNSLFSSFLIPKERQDPMGFELPPLSSLRSLCKLDLGNCNFSKGFLPDDLGSLSSLEFLYLSGSNIIGLPASIGYHLRLSNLMLKDCKKLKTLPYLPISISFIDASGCTSLEIFTDLRWGNRWDNCRFSRSIILINCHTLAKNQPDLHIQLIRNLIKNIAHLSHYTIIFPGREIPKYFNYQNNMGHYIRFQLMPDWCQRLEGFVVCVVFEAKAPINAQVYVERYGIRNDVVDHIRGYWTDKWHFGSDHLFMTYRRFGGVTVNRMKTWTGMMFYFTSNRPEMVVPVKCAVEMIDEEEGQLIEVAMTVINWIQLNDSQFELSESQNIRNSVMLKGDSYPRIKAGINYMWTNALLDED
ncbi:disease resistance-like protein DSC1 [Diospyros lotus]|uniref:disease resistance-like protein DSC1 n=1 Tax=Diospyros lotus TaxID=55363 RepID=UPI00225056EF|nr:disease resistance-like protein DSC1 [Diospyros lotus]